MRRARLEKLSRHTAFSVVSEQLGSDPAGTDLDAAIAQQKAGLHTPAEQAIHLAHPAGEPGPDLPPAPAAGDGNGNRGQEGFDGGHRHDHPEAQIRSGQLLNVPVAHGYGNDLLISRQTWDAEKHPDGCWKVKTRWPPDGPRAGQSDDGPDRRTAGGDG